jgi:thiamine biosynthesis lipoprotein
VKWAWDEASKFWRGYFTAMGSPCEILIDSDEQSQAEAMCELAFAETVRIERKYSRYRDDSTLSKINGGHGRPLTVDAETAQLLDYAEQC